MKLVDRTAARGIDGSAADYLPPQRSIRALRAAVQHCQGCELFRHATQAVFGEGRARAVLMLVGETPGEQEDLAGKPFVGPAGKLLDDALAAAGIDRQQVYVTNAVKHFKWEPRGKRRLHKKPSSREIKACRPWLEAEIAAVEPHTIVCLGATAAQTLLGRTFRITQHLGEVLDSPWAKCILATYHPAAILRAPDASERHRLRDQFFAYLRLAAETLLHPAGAAFAAEQRDRE